MIGSAEDTFGVLIADDHQLFRDGLKALVAAMPEARLMGEAEDGVTAVRLAESLAPEVVVMDLRMPQLDGVEATRRILARQPDTRVLVVSMLEDDAWVFAAIRAGARGYLLKGAGHVEVMAAIRAVRRGEAIFGAAIAGRMATYFQRVTPSQQEAFPQLTGTEQDILRLLAQGLQNPQIAERLHLAPKTVRNNVSAILAKLNVADRTEAALRARDAGFRGRETGG